MIGGTILFVIILIVVGWLVLTGLYIVQQQHVYIIEQFGKFHALKGPGLHLKLPAPFQTVAAKMSLRTMQVQQKLNVKTKDNVTVTISIATNYTVDQRQAQCQEDSGVYRAYYMLTDPVAQMNSYIADALRSAVTGVSLDELFETKDQIAQQIYANVSQSMSSFGWFIVSTLITNIDLPKEIEESMNKINSAQRQRAAAQDLAEADRIRVVTEAKAEAQRMKLQGVGIAEQRKQIALGIKESLDTITESGVSAAEANELFKFTQWADVMSDFAKNGNCSTVVLPSDFRESASTFEQMLAAESAPKLEHKISDDDDGFENVEIR